MTEAQYSEFITCICCVNQNWSVLLFAEFLKDMVTDLSLWYVSHFKDSLKYNVPFRRLVSAKSRCFKLQN